MTDQHDVVIVGAGPGGSAAAHYLAKHGLDVLLLDKANFPRDKTCGDGLTDRVHLRFDGVPLPGYGWVFPLSPSSANGEEDY
jgi:flavin-dependent dehydrogenase